MSDVTPVSLTPVRKKRRKRKRVNGWKWTLANLSRKLGSDKPGSEWSAIAIFLTSIALIAGLCQIADFVMKWWLGHF